METGSDGAVRARSVSESTGTDGLWLGLPEGECVHELVSRRALEAPGALAVAGPESELSYQALELQSNNLADLLRQRGLEREACVGLFLPRSPEFVVAALASLKSGAAYLPLDIGYPQIRISRILSDAGVRLVIARAETAHLLPSGPWETVIFDQRGAATQGEAKSAARAIPENLAYVIYTSGSTGDPKGVEISHASLMNLVAWHQKNFHVTADDRATLLTSPGFDAAVWEIWPYLAAGASLHLPDESTRLSPEKLRDWLVDQAITISFAPTVIAERLIGLSWPKAARLRYLLTGADTLHIRPPAALPFKLINNYGPTECTVVATSGEVAPADAGAEGGGTRELPSIGRPIANTEAWIVDAEMRPVPVGAAGELCIIGPGLARGYRNHPEMTAARFVHNPRDGRRMYRTGDSARQMGNGEIQFLGRMDDQIKIRGFRIEPAEIEMALNRRADVAESAVIAREDSPGEKRLVAYIVSGNGAAPDESDLADYLRRELPDYMVPSAFVALKSLPLTAHGKLDRGALPAPDSHNEDGEREYIAPRTPVEERLAAILASLMGLERVSVHENFFLLGGHSLLGTQVISRVRDSFGIELPLRSLFDAPTVADLSSEIERMILKKLETVRGDDSPVRAA